MEQSKVKNPRLAKFAKSLKRHWPLFIFLGPYALLFITFFIYPFFYGIYISFFRWNLFEPSASTYVGFENFQRALFGVGEITIWRDYFWNGLRNTVLFVVLSVPFLIILPLIIAILLDLEPRFYKAFRVIFFMPTVLSVSAVAIIFKWQFDTNAGLVNGILSLFGLGDTAWLNTQPGAWIVIVITTIWWTIGTNTVIFGAGLKEVDKAQYEAAELDGCNYFKVLWHISLPNIRNQMFICTITTIIASFNIYGQPHIITGGGPERTTTVLMMVIRGLLSGSNAQPGLAAAMALLLGIVIISVSLIQHFHNKKAGA